jgi:hypothetical protein
VTAFNAYVLNPTDMARARVHLEDTEGAELSGRWSLLTAKGEELVGVQMEGPPKDAPTPSELLIRSSVLAPGSTYVLRFLATGKSGSATHTVSRTHTPTTGVDEQVEIVLCRDLLDSSTTVLTSDC